MTVTWVAPSSSGISPRSGAKWPVKKPKAQKASHEDGEETRQILINAWVALDEGRERSKQTLIGPSQLMGCPRKVFFELVGQERVNSNVDLLGALIGTAMHNSIEEALKLAIAEGKAEGIPELTVPGIPEIGLGDGHIDYWRPGVITDWKSIALKSLKYFPGKKRIYQPNVYGYLAREAGYEVEHIELVAIPRDGKFTDVQVHRFPYDESKALEAIEWLKERQENARNGELPAADPSPLCAYCPFFGPGVCEGK